MSEIVNHYERCENEYHVFIENLQDILNDNPDIPEEIANPIKEVIAAKNFDLVSIQMALIDQPAEWAQEISSYLRSLDGNEVFYDIERGCYKPRKE